VGLPSGFLDGGSGFEAAASCGVAMSTERPVALRVLRIGALVRADGGASTDMCRSWVGVSARAESRRSDLYPPSGLFLPTDLVQMLVWESVGSDGPRKNPWSCDHNGGDAVGRRLPWTGR
jgi:hypothetical protein